MSRYSAAFEAVLAESKGHNERMDCTVKALTITTGKSYDDCHAAMKAQGRKNRSRARLSWMIPAAALLGYHMTVMNPGAYQAKTIRTVETDRKLKSGNYIVSTSGHVVAVRAGNVIDHSEGGLRRVQTIYSMTPIAGHQAATPAPSIQVPAHQWAPVPQQLALI